MAKIAKPKSVWKLAKGKWAWIKRNAKGEKVKQGVASSMAEARKKAGTSKQQKKQAKAQKKASKKQAKAQKKASKKQTKIKQPGGSMTKKKQGFKVLYLLGLLPAGASAARAYSDRGVAGALDDLSESFLGYDLDTNSFTKESIPKAMKGTGALIVSVGILRRALRWAGIKGMAGISTGA